MLTRRQAAVDVGLTVLLVVASALVASVGVALFSSGAPSLPVAVILQGLLAVAGGYVLLEWREQGWSDIGLIRPEWRDVPRAVLVLLAGFAVNAALAAVTLGVSPQTLERHIDALGSVAADLTVEASLPQALAVLVVVGFYEEVVSRGLLLTRSRRLLGGYTAPVLFSAIVFSLGHFYQGVYGVLQTALFGVVLAVFTLHWRTLWPAIIAHTAINMLSLFQLDDVASRLQILVR